MLYGPSREQVFANLKVAADHLYSLGWLVNLDKSSVIPSSGTGWTLSQNILHTKDKVDKLCSVVQGLIDSPAVSLRSIMRVLGLMTSAIPAVVWAQAHTRTLQQFLLAHWGGDLGTLDRQVSLSREVRYSLGWWLDPRTGQALEAAESNSVNHRCQLLGLGSSSGGAVWTGYLEHNQPGSLFKFQGAEGSFLALHHFAAQLRGRHVQVRSDNAVTVAYINKWGHQVAAL